MNRIHLVSGPRNISTALMYAFGNRGDMTIIDEPLYAYYLNKHPEIDHPMRSQVLEAQSADYDTVIDQVFLGNFSTPWLLIKNMAHHLDDSDLSFIKKMKNIFLIRNPEQLIASLAQVIPNPTILDIGLKLEYEIFNYASSIKAFSVVIDSGEILKDPQKMLSMLCDKLAIPFSDKMLQWEKGPRKEDGVWAPYWYKNVHQSVGFQKQETSKRLFPERLLPLLMDAKKYYDLLYDHSLKV